MIKQAKKQTLRVGDSIPYKATIHTTNKSRLDISYKQKVYSLRGRLKTSLKKITKARLYSYETSHVLGIRGLYEGMIAAMNVESKKSFDSFVVSYGGKVKDYKGWNSIIAKTFAKLQKHSGFGLFPLEFAVLRNRHFNAATFPGGQFVIHTGTLDFLDTKITSTSKPAIAQERENLIAGILGHELGHYYNRHAFRSMKRVIIREDSEKELSDDAEEENLLSDLVFEQDLEFEADLASLLLLRKAKYDEKLIVKMLGILREVSQSDKSDNYDNPFFHTHPSPLQRLARFKSKEQELYRLAAKMESVYSNIDLGRNLAVSEALLVAWLKKYKNNASLLKALAICRHKIWLKTAPLVELRMRTMIVSPVFDDDIIFKSGGRRGSKKIPGDKKKFLRAIKSYAKAMRYNPQPSLLANFAALLAYSPEKKQEDQAVQLGERALRLQEDVQTMNNLALVYFLTRKEKQAYAILADLARQLTRRIKDLRFAMVFNPGVHRQLMQIMKEDKIRSKLNRRYVSKNYTPILNLCLLEFELGKFKEAKQHSKVYLEKFDTKSKWAKLLQQRMK
ncbi:MAG: M48 family metallopeptidase [Spirochaetota bacterium]